MKKLLFVTTALWVGGIERALVDLLWELAPDYGLTVLLLRRDLTLAPELPPGCRLMVADREGWLARLTEPPMAPSRLHRAFQWAFSALGWLEEGLFARKVRALAGTDYHRILIFSQNAAGVGLRAFRRQRPILFYQHGALPDTARGWRSCGKIVAASGQLVAQLREKFPETAGKIVEIPNILSGERILGLSRAFEPGFPAGLLCIVTVGRLHRDKGMDLAVEAAAILRRRGLEFRWYLLGGGPEEEILREKIRYFGLENAVFLLGMVENPYPFVANADLYVQPSRVEAYGLAMAEARILGRPVLATDTSGARAQLPEQAICPAQPEALAAKILEFSDHRISAKKWDWRSENRKSMEKLRDIL